jgi:hypothetical protein
MAIAASNEWSGNGSSSAAACTTGAAPAARCAIMTPDGSTAVTALPASPWAFQIRAAHLGSA